VAPREKRDQEALDGGILADDGLADFGAEFLGPCGTGGHVGAAVRAGMRAGPAGRLKGRDPGGEKMVPR
jgi:hypothetical protein